VAQVDGGYSSGTWGEAGWGCSVYYPVISNAGWGNGPWGGEADAYGGWGLGNGGLIVASDSVNVAAQAAIVANIAETVTATEYLVVH
jgi:hypothetical protein